MARKLQVLCLHGFNSNAAVFARRTRTWTEACADTADFHYLDAPHLVPLQRGLQGVDDYATEAELGVADPPLDTGTETLEANMVKQAQAQVRVAPDRRARGWWRLRDHEDLWGWDTCIAYLNEQLARIGPVDAVFGFSQGAALSLMLTATFEQAIPSDGNTQRVPPLPALIPHPDQQPLRLCIAVAGFRLRQPTQAALFDRTLRTPVLSINGLRDPVVTATKSARASVGFENWNEVYHSNGHSVPFRPPWPTYIRDTLKRFASGENPSWVDPPKGIATQMSPEQLSAGKSNI